jgi:hypothetical protein
MKLNHANEGAVVAILADGMTLTQPHWCLALSSSRRAGHFGWSAHCYLTRLLRYRCSKLNRAIRARRLRAVADTRYALSLTQAHHQKSSLSLFRTVIWNRCCRRLRGSPLKVTLTRQHPGRKNRQGDGFHRQAVLRGPVKSMELVAATTESAVRICLGNSLPLLVQEVKPVVEGKQLKLKLQLLQPSYRG